MLRLVTAFAVAMKLHLRSVPLDTQLASLMSEKQYLHLQDSDHAPLQIAYWIGDYLQYQHDRNCLNVYNSLINYSPSFYRPFTNFAINSLTSF